MIAVPLIGTNWLGSTGNLPFDQVLQCLWLMGVALIPQIAMSLYFGGLMGLQHQVLGNFLWTGYSVARSGLVVIPIYFIPDIRVFFVWQALVSITMLFVMREVLRKCIISPANKASPCKIKGTFSWAVLRPIRGYASGMLGISIVAGLNTQLDKLVVSKILPLGEFAQYSLASTLAQVPYILTVPIALALLPRLTNIMHRDDQRGELIGLYRNATYYIASIGSVSGFGFCFFMPDIFSIWMHDREIGPEAVQAASLLVLGSILLTLQLAPFQLSLANGHQSTNLRLGSVMLLITVPLQVILTKKYGIIGAGFTWLFLNLVSFIYLGIMLNMRFSLISLRKWFFKDNIIPVSYALFWLLIARFVAFLLQTGAIPSCVIAASGAFAAIGTSYVLRSYEQDRLRLSL
jgi:O-antigen/teichoic acid export membrane protein